MKYKHIIWDYNGTILDDVEVCLGILNTMLATQGAPPHDLQEYRDVFGFPIKEYYTRAGFDFGQKSFEALADDFWPLYREGLETTVLREGIVDVLRAIGESEATQSILSAALQAEVASQIADFGIGDCFTHISGLSDVYAKSKVQLIPGHLASIECDISEILFVGDTTHDALVAREMGCDCVLIAQGHQSCQRLRDTGYPVVDDAQELLEYISG